MKRFVGSKAFGKAAAVAGFGLSVFAVNACGEMAKRPQEEEGATNTTPKPTAGPKNAQIRNQGLERKDGGQPKNPVETDLKEGGQQKLAVTFQPKVGTADLACSDKSDAMVASGEIFSDVRFFVSNLSLVDGAGQVTSLTLDAKDLQFTDSSGTSIALLNFLEADCASSDATRTVNTSISGFLKTGQYKTLRFQLGLPYPAMDARLVAMPAALAPSDMGWMWEHYPADLQIETNAGASLGLAPRLMNSLTREKKITLDFPLDLSVTASSAAQIDLKMDLSKIFPSTGAAFAAGLENSCNNNTSLPNATDVNCAHAFKAFGFDVKGASAPSAQTVFSVVP